MVSPAVVPAFVAVASLVVPLFGPPMVAPVERPTASAPSLPAPTVPAPLLPATALPTADASVEPRIDEYPLAVDVSVPDPQTQAGARRAPATGETAESAAPDGEVPDGEAPDGEVPDGEAPDGEAPDGEVPDGEAPDGEAPESGSPESEAPSDDSGESEAAEEAEDGAAPSDEPALADPPAEPAEPVAPGDELELEAVDDVAAGPVVENEGFQTVAVSWPDDLTVEVPELQVRTRSQDGDWTGWQHLEVADEQPDAGTVDAEVETRSGTGTMYVGESDAVQVATVDAVEELPADVRLTLISTPEPTEVPAAEVAGAASTGEAVTTNALFVESAGATVATAAAGPAVISRGGWGAAPQACTPDTASRLVGAVIHHTANPNSYTSVAQAMQVIRNDQAYHINTRGWCDLGYNFVVDKWGNVYEGRANSMTKPIIGVHAGGFNTSTVGIAFLGDHSSVAPSNAAVQAVAHVVGFRLGAYGVRPDVFMSYTTRGGENSRYPAGTTVTLPTTFGHRDVAYTACPGQVGYTHLQSIRDRATAYGYGAAFNQARSVVRALYDDLLGRAADSSGLTTWTSKLASGTSRESVVRSLTRSEEYVRLRVREAYVDVLGRQPDAAGLNSWTRGVMSGDISVDAVALLFYRTPEFYQRSGGNDDAFVRRLYQVMLGRSASASEVANWRGRIASSGRAAVASGVWGSREAANNRAGGYYEVFLGRAPDFGGKSYWGGVLLTRGEGAVREGIAGSVEYRNLALRRFPE
ncbi:DUF4214 domain-containing protein [Cellulosimicrobium sp. Marseille-Q4280]|uniref:DUF4214 domain-containing protein n=1 Tax=Cellulosimicrobium sp. Marseille-Q4280 TaxID=2937992 RepID=UPI00203DF1B8|nr:DUF4214 domain-containing protein [Cellulosimicrobium sp. Marseille-Q4280]